jgi:hypothetical protein
MFPSSLRQVALAVIPDVVSQRHNTSDEFDATVYKVGTEYVIAIRGSEVADGDWFTSTIPALLGSTPAQLRDALDYYDDVRAALGPDAPGRNDRNGWKSGPTRLSLVDR